MKQENKIIAGFILLVLCGFFAKLALAIPKDKMPEKLLSAEISESIIQNQEPKTELVSKTEMDMENAEEKNDKKKFPENLEVESAMAIDLSSNEEYFSYNEEKRWPIASVTKVMTSVVALENYNLEDEVTISEKAVETYGTAGDLHAEEIYSVKDMVTAMMVVSSNDAAIALSEKMNEDGFVEAMNKKAESLGMNNTYFKEPTGLSSLNQSTLSDMLILVRYAWLNYPDLFSTSHKTKVSITELTEKKVKTLTNINQLVYNADFIGGKTGFTDDAKQNLISVFTLDDKKIILMIFGAEDRIVEAKKIINFLKEKQKSSDNKNI